MTRTAAGWLIASYAFPSTDAQVAAIEWAIQAVDPTATLTGLPLVNRELSDRFLPQFIRGLAIGTLIVVVIVVWAFRDWWLSVLALLPTAVGLVWAAGLLALAGSELDLFALFAVVTFVGIGVDYGIHLVQRYRERGEAAPRHRGAGAGHPGRRGDYRARLRHPRDVELSAPALHRGRVRGQRRRAGSGVGCRAAGAADEAGPHSGSGGRQVKPTGSPLPAALPVPRRWTLHGLNNGRIFAATRFGVRHLPRVVVYAIGHVGTWIAWRMMATSRAAIADNLCAIFPGETRAALERRALETFRSYARDVIDFLRALTRADGEATDLFDVTDAQRRFFDDLRAEGRGIILVTGHFGNWEVGGVLFRMLALPLTIVAMAEADPTVNRIRREIRDQIGADTIEVRQSLDTALQIRRCLGQNRVVAMLVDRHYGRDRVGVTLFGRRAWFLRTPFVMAHVTGAPVLPCSVERRGPGRFAIRPGTPIHLATDLPRDEAIARAAQLVADTLEERIRAHPEFWYQFYRYWDAQHDAYDGLA